MLMTVDKCALLMIFFMVFSSWMVATLKKLPANLFYEQTMRSLIQASDTVFSTPPLPRRLQVNHSSSSFHTFMWGRCVLWDASI